VVVDTSGVHIGTTLRNRGVFQRVGHVMDRMYPCRLQVRGPHSDRSPQILAQTQLLDGDGAGPCLLPSCVGCAAWLYSYP
jgi:hypothetical protein